MGKNVEPLLNSGELTEIFLKGSSEPESLTPTERLRMNAILVSSFRRLESVYVQYTLGTMEQENKRGFEESMNPLLQMRYGKEWWDEAKISFYKPYVRYIDEGIASGKFSRRPPSMQFGKPDE
jgi:hypothetical protein